MDGWCATLAGGIPSQPALPCPDRQPAWHSEGGKQLACGLTTPVLCLQPELLKTRNELREMGFHRCICCLHTHTPEIYCVMS